MTLKTYIKNKKNNKYRISGVDVEIHEKVPSNINLNQVINTALQRIPDHLLSNLKSIKIGDFDVLRRREIQAMYKDSTVYVTNMQDDEDDLLDDIIHEIAHSIEETHYKEIYEDGLLEQEFINKRKAMWQTLKSRGLEFDLGPFLEPSYSKQFDDLLHNTIGYKTLRLVLQDIFYSPYASTSIREYFANGFEAFFMKEDIPRLKRLSPVLYKKIIILMDKRDEF